MTCRRIRAEEREGFIDYCRRNRDGLDDSYLYDEDLETFRIGEDNPTALLISTGGEVVGAASLIIQDYIDGRKKGRIRILHCESGDRAEYHGLLAVLSDSIHGLDHIYGFVDESNNQQMTAFKAYGFVVDRYSWVLTRPPLAVEKPVFPEGYSLKDFEYDRDEWAYLKVRNAAFATIKGSETPQTLEGLRAFKDESTHMLGGIQMVWKGDEPAGLIRVFKETEAGIDYAFVAPIAIAPNHQGLGLGRLLLRAGIYFGQQQGMAASMLCVNAENEKAVALYLQEGYEKVQVMVCLQLKNAQLK